MGNLNPLNWFKADNLQSPGTAQTLAPRRGYGYITDTRLLVDQVTTLKVEKTATGAIIRTTGLPATQGFNSAELVLVASDRSNEVTFQFRVRPPTQPTQTSPVFLREIVAAQFISNAQLRGIRRINVIAQRNRLSTRP